MTLHYGVFTPRGELVAAFKDRAAADAMARYDMKEAGERLYWSMAPQPVTVAPLTLDAEPPENRHTIAEVDRGYVHCQTYKCARHWNKPTPAQVVDSA